MNYMTYPTYLGIDPGAHGCIVAITPRDDDHPLVAACRLHNHARFEVIDWVRQYDGLGGFGDNPHVAIEKVSSSPQMGVRSAFSFGQSFGWLEGILQTLGFPHQYVRPQTWQSDLQIPPRKKKTQPEHKRVILDFARAAYPQEIMTADVADALLIAHWCRQQHKGEER